MRLARGIKLNIVIAILLCIAFVLNAGYTLAATAYNLKVSSIGGAQAETYTGFAGMQGEGDSYTAKYVYSVGSVNNAIKLNYGFSSEFKYNVAVKFTATYTNSEHGAKDFSLNIVNRDKWCVDMNTVTDLTNSSSYYALGSADNSISGVMYYMGTIDGVGRLPVISGVTFYTSGNNSYNYEGDILTVQVTPIYVKAPEYNAEADTYTTSHKFYDAVNMLNSSNTAAIDNWREYMNAYVADKTTIDSTRYMYYNAYASGDTALEFPSDVKPDSVTDANESKKYLTWDAQGNLIMPSAEIYQSNTAYRYKVVRDGDGSQAAPYTYSATYDNVIAGNKYYGGLGVYVIPDSDMVTVDISFSYNWYGPVDADGDGVTDKDDSGKDKYDIITGVFNPIGYKHSSQITKVGTAYYYNCTITEPTYINVLEYMLLKAESGFKTALQKGYKVVIYNLTANAHTSTPDGVVLGTKPSVEINNSSIQSGILVRQSSWNNGPTRVETDVTVHNNGDTDLAISKFTVKGTLWHSKYDENFSGFAEQAVGVLADVEDFTGALLYRGVTVDENMWTYASYIDGVYTFTRKPGANYIPAGSSLTLIDGVVANKLSYPAANDAAWVTSNGVTSAWAYDYWCTLDIDIIYGSASYGTHVNSGSSDNPYTDLEVETNGYYSPISPSSPAYVYVRNNTNQNINNVSIRSMQLYGLTSTKKPVRAQINTGNPIDYTVYNYITGDTSTTATITLSPNEKVLLFRITPNADAIIYDYIVAAGVVSGKVAAQPELTSNNQSGDANVINTGTDCYEFRLKSTSSFSAKLVDSASFVVNTAKASDGYYYAYYKGVICPNQLIKAFSGFDSSINLDIDFKVHTQGWDAAHYVAANYSDWSADTSGAFAGWLTAMQAIYGQPV